MSWYILWSFQDSQSGSWELEFRYIYFNSWRWPNGRVQDSSSVDNKEKSQHKVHINKERRSLMLVLRLKKPPTMVPQTSVLIHKLHLESCIEQSIMKITIHFSLSLLGQLIHHFSTWNHQPNLIDIHNFLFYFTKLFHLYSLL